jgi:hypothetical protein
LDKVVTRVHLGKRDGYADFLVEDITALSKELGMKEAIM